MRGRWLEPIVASMDRHIANAPGPTRALWARVFAGIYDPILWVGERAGMRRHRRELLARARGRTLEIGSGTGLNLIHYPHDLDGLVLAEPDPSMRKRLENAVRRSQRNAQVIDAGAEQLPFDDATFDTIVSTLVLCTVDAPDVALREIGRVLRPDGQLLFIEHVRSDSPTLARWQDRLARPWRRFAEGCHCNRATLEQIDACGFRQHAHPAAWRGMPPIIRPLVVGAGEMLAASMTRAVPRLAISVMPLENRLDVIRGLAASAERLDYEAFLVPETWSYDAHALLAAIARETERISAWPGGCQQLVAKPRDDRDGRRDARRSVARAISARARSGQRTTRRGTARSGFRAPGRAVAPDRHPGPSPAAR